MRETGVSGRQRPPRNSIDAGSPASPRESLHPHGEMKEVPGTQASPITLLVEGRAMWHPQQELLCLMMASSLLEYKKVHQAFETHKKFGRLHESLTIVDALSC